MATKVAGAGSKGRTFSADNDGATADAELSLELLDLVVHEVQRAQLVDAHFAVAWSAF